MEKIMSTEISELTDTELDAVSGGGSGAHIQDAIIETFGGGGGGWDRAAFFLGWKIVGSIRSPLYLSERA